MASTTTSTYRGQSYITVLHDLNGKRPLFATVGHDHKAVVDLTLHGGDPEQVGHVYRDMSAAHAKGVGVGAALRNA